jgi:hypothetical protein
MDVQQALKALTNKKAEKLHGKFMDKLAESLEILVDLYEETDMDVNRAGLIGDVAVGALRILEREK